MFRMSYEFRSEKVRDRFRTLVSVHNLEDIAIQPTIPPKPLSNEPLSHNLLDHECKNDIERQRRQLWIDVYNKAFNRLTVRGDEAEHATHCANDALAEFDRSFSSPEKDKES